MATRRILAQCWIWPVLLGAGCSGLGERDTPGDAGLGTGASRAPLERTLATSDGARTRIERIKARFIARPAQPNEGPAATPVVGDGVVDRFEVVDHRVHPIFAASAATARPPTTAARVELPERASDPVGIEDQRSHVAVRFSLAQARDSKIEVAAGLALYRDALDGSDVVHRLRVEGTEDFVVFEQKPARELLEYRVDVTRVAGVRLVANSVEFMDEGGTPRLRIEPPYVVDGSGKTTPARLTIDDCAYDTDPAPPWGRRVTPPKSTTCVVRVAWSGVEYPAIVDPSWSITTGQMNAIRVDHTATLLDTGKVLVAGGGWTSAWSMAELYDPASDTFAATGDMKSTRRNHTATKLTSGTVLITGGLNAGSGIVSLAELYDPSTGVFTQIGSMVTPRFKHTATRLDSGKVLLVGGTDGGTAMSVAELYDPASGPVGGFAGTGAMAIGRQFHTSTLLPSGKVLVAGGISTAAVTGAPTSAAELYDPSGTFATAGTMTVARQRHTATLLPSGKVLIAGQGTTELYDPASGFAASGALVDAREFHTATLLSSGKVLFVGGGMSFALSTAEVFDPLGSSVPTSPMAVSRMYHTATLLPSGKVFVVGGANYRPGELFGQLAPGSACAGAGDCVSGFCVDGYCCNAACGSMCQACNVAGSLGTCTAVKGTPVGSRTCGTYLCAGTGASCPASCTSDADCSSGSWCNAGACVAKSSNGAACPTGDHECSSAHCADGVCCNTACTQQCEACDVPSTRGVCTAVVGAPHTGHAACTPGTACVTPQCDGATRSSCAGTTFVAGGTACGSEVCTGTVLVAQRCDGAGSCAASPVGTDCAPFLCKAGACTTTCGNDSDCSTDAFCASGACKKKQANGATCGGASECNSGFCIDGVCCNSVCGGQCEACDAPGAEGTCAAVAGAPHGKRAACPSGDAKQPCRAALCDGVTRTSCEGFVGSSVTCRTAACDGQRLLPGSTCDGKGACPTTDPIDCGAYACDASAGQCKTTCANDADCTSGSRCSNARCVSGASCADDHTSVAADGTRSDCAPYRCETSGTCGKSCAATTDCLQGAVCDLTSQLCVPSAPAEDSEGGCSVSRRATVGVSAWWLALATYAFAHRRRQRVRAQPTER